MTAPGPLDPILRPDDSYYVRGVDNTSAAAQAIPDPVLSPPFNTNPRLNAKNMIRPFPYKQDASLFPQRTTPPPVYQQLVPAPAAPAAPAAGRGGVPPPPPPPPARVLRPRVPRRGGAAGGGAAGGAGGAGGAGAAGGAPGAAPVGRGRGRGRAARPPHQQIPPHPSLLTVAPHTSLYTGRGGSTG